MRQPRQHGRHAQQPRQQHRHHVIQVAKCGNTGQGQGQQHAQVAKCRDAAQVPCCFIILFYTLGPLLWTSSRIFWWGRTVGPPMVRVASEPVPAAVGRAWDWDWDWDGDGEGRIGATRAESQWIVAARPLCHLQYPVAYLSRLQRILPAARWELCFKASRAARPSRGVRRRHVPLGAEAPTAGRQTSGGRMRRF
ncbi:hypothetical protein L6164_037931 [Bauhinia variegata]|nr:hypothetical protein L6164_037931 [Bauhinia variegata]